MSGMLSVPKTTATKPGPPREPGGVCGGVGAAQGVG